VNKDRRKGEKERGGETERSYGEREKVRIKQKRSRGKRRKKISIA
jgi:hypothetical protein